MNSSTGANGAWSAARRFRFDATFGPNVLGKGHSGRAIVLLGLVGLALLTGSIFGAFHLWKARYAQRAAFGRTEVVPAVAPLAEFEPPGVAPGDWLAAVADTQRVLEAVTASGMLDQAAMARLRDELRARVARTTPDTAIRELAAIWDDLEARAGPVLSREPTRGPRPPRRPKLLAGP